VAALGQGVAAVIGEIGVPVVQADTLGLDLEYDQMFLSATQSAIVVGDLPYFRYRMEQIRLNDECRKAAAAHIVRVAEEILGEPWTVGGNL
jgi:hypothetical protein